MEPLRGVPALRSLDKTVCCLARHALETALRDLTFNLGECPQHVTEQVLGARDCALQLFF
jgi:hypothetical protein